MKSKPLSLNQTDWPIIGMAFVVGLGLHVAEHMVEFGTATDFGSLTPLVPATVPPMAALLIRFEGQRSWLNS